MEERFFWLEHRESADDDEGGSFAHYHHFLVDFLTAFHSYYVDEGLEEYDHVKINYYTIHHSQKLHRYKKIINITYPNVEIIEITKYQSNAGELRRVGGESERLLREWGPAGYWFSGIREWEVKGCELVKVERKVCSTTSGRIGQTQLCVGGKWGWYKEVKLLDSLVSRAWSISETTKPTGKKVILIRRSIESFHEDIESIESGSLRRVLVGSQELEQSLRDFYGDSFAVLELEKMSFVDQVRYFRHANLVIGVHGGGLTNILWCREDGNVSVVEVGSTQDNPNSAVPYFKSLAEAKNVNYIRKDENDGDFSFLGLLK